MTYFKIIFFMKELMREKLGTKLKLEVELDFRKIAGVLSCVYSQREQKKCLSHGSVRGCCSYRTKVSGIRAWSSLPKCVLTVKGCLIIYLSFWNSSAPCDCFLNMMWSPNVTSRCLWWLSKQYLWKTSFSWNGRDPAGCAAPLLWFVSLHTNNCWEAVSVTEDRHKAVLGNESNK